VSTNREVITAALRMLTVLDSDQTASAEDAALALAEMNDMIALWLVDGIDMGYPPQDNLSDEFPLDNVAEAQVKPLLAMSLFTHYPSAKFPDSLPVRAAGAMAQLKRSAVLANRQESSVSHAPRGERASWQYNIVSDE
jgi:hypothetical protein